MYLVLNILSLLNEVSNSEDKGRAILENILVIIAGHKGTQTLIALEIMEQYRFATLEETDEILYYYNGVYKRGGEVVIKKIIETDYMDYANISLRREVLDHIRCITYQPLSAFDTDLNIINKPNGLYHIDTDRLEPHDPDYLSLIQNPIPYIEGAKPKLFGKFLSGLVYPRDVRTLVDSMSYTFWRSNPFDAIIVLVADGSNGKSVLFIVLSKSHGPKNVSNVPLKTLIDRPFGPYALVGKNCNLDEELTNGPLPDTAILKKLTGNLEKYVEGKGLPGFEAKIYAKIWMSANNMLQLVNPTSADYRRFIPIPLPNQFDLEADLEHGIYKLDPELADKLTTEEELAGIFNVMMISLRRVLKNRRIFQHEKTIKQRREKFELTADPIKVFIESAFLEPEEVAKYNDKQCVKKETTFQAYNIFRKEKRLPILSKESLGKELKSRSWKDGKIADENDKRHWAWSNVRMRDEWMTKVKPYESGKQGTLD